MLVKDAQIKPYSNSFCVQFFEILQQNQFRQFRVRAHSPNRPLLMAGMAFIFSAILSRGFEAALGCLDGNDRRRKVLAQKFEPGRQLRSIESKLNLAVSCGELHDQGFRNTFPFAVPPRKHLSDLVSKRRGDFCSGGSFAATKACS